MANQRVEQQLSAARDDAAKRLADAERLGQQMVEEAKTRASEEGAKIIAAARAEAEQEAVKAREVLREQVAGLAVKGAEAILRREVNAGRACRVVGPPEGGTLTMRPEAHDCSLLSKRAPASHGATGATARPVAARREA